MFQLYFLDAVEIKGTNWSILDDPFSSDVCSRNISKPIENFIPSSNVRS